ncbi:Hsp20/alpha crystallin family protein [Echinicola salinicaeni]|uniref:Hsp20/alpha crystallin family protein n=1 Tax=Echinicola salinicaeni TaxID=2762757 RepID=UPI00164859A2|nr:Hsp20/alpha crystallin family protein [Echinicola salinicaeni]
MSHALKKNNGSHSVFSDLLQPMSWFNRDLFDFDTNLMSSRLGINMPTANITEGPKEYRIDLAAPGLEQKDFNIEIENGTLCISAEREEEKDVKEDEFSRKEYSFNSFSRSFGLPDNIDEGKIEAKYSKGVLKVTIPKSKETPAKPVHKIEVK